MVLPQALTEHLRGTGGVQKGILPLTKGRLWGGGNTEIARSREEEEEEEEESRLVPPP